LLAFNVNLPPGWNYDLSQEIEGIDFSKNDIFTLALLVLELGLLNCRASECMDFKSGLVDFQVI
jgi:hypothetical protein